MFFKRVMLVIVFLGLLFALVNCSRPGPVASFEVLPVEGKVGEPIVFDGSKSDGEWYDINFGDGKDDEGSQPRFTHTYTESGDYSVDFRAWNISGFLPLPPDCMCGYVITVTEPGPPPLDPCDTDPLVTISLSHSKIGLGGEVGVVADATDPTGGLIEWIEAVVTSPLGDERQIPRVPGGHLEFPIIGDEEDTWHIVVTCQNSCPTQEMIGTASASFLVEEDTPPPPTCEDPTLRAKADGNYVSNNSTLQRETGDSISLRIETEDDDDCGPCGIEVDGIVLIRVHVWKGNEANTVFSWDTSQGTMSLSNPYKIFSFDEEGTYGVDTTVQDDDCDLHREAELHFLIEVEDPYVPPSPTCEDPTLRAKADGNYVSNNSTLQRETGDSISLRIEAEDDDDCGSCGIEVDGIVLIRVHIWKGNEANTVFSWDTSQGTMSLSNPCKTFSFDEEGTYGVDTTVQDDDCDRRREAELHFLIEVEDPYVPPSPPVYELDVSNLTRPSGPNYTCHQISAIIRMVSGEAEGPMSIRWSDGNESLGLTGIHQYSEADGYVIQALNGAGEVVAYASINIQFRECVAPEIEVISAPLLLAFVGDSYIVSFVGSDEDQEWTSCLCQDSCVAGHGIYRAQINVFDPLGNLVKSRELECSEVAFPMTLTGTFDEIGDYRLVIWILDDDNLCGCLCNCAHDNSVELNVHVIQRP